MKLVSVENLPAEGTGRYFHFEHRKFPGPHWQYCDVRQYILEREEAWFETIQAWHAEISRLATGITSWWWLMPGSRLHGFQPNFFQYFFFALAVVDLAETLPGSEPFYLVRCNQDVIDYIRELRPHWEITVSSIVDTAAPPPPRRPH